MEKCNDEPPEQREWTVEILDFGFPHKGKYVPLDADPPDSEEPERQRPPEEPLNPPRAEGG